MPLLVKTALMANPKVGWRSSVGSPAKTDSRVDFPAPLYPRQRTENSGLGSGAALQHSLRQHYRYMTWDNQKIEGEQLNVTWVHLETQSKVMEVK